MITDTNIREIAQETGLSETELYEIASEINFEKRKSYLEEYRCFETAFRDYIKGKISKDIKASIIFYNAKPELYVFQNKMGNWVLRRPRTVEKYKAIYLAYRELRHQYPVGMMVREGSRYDETGIMYICEIIAREHNKTVTIKEHMKANTILKILYNNFKGIK